MHGIDHYTTDEFAAYTREHLMGEAEDNDVDDAIDGASSDSSVPSLESDSDDE